MAIRKIGVASRTYRHVNRYRQILTVLFRYGFGGLVDALRIGQYLEVGWQLITREHHEQLAKLSAYERIRLALADLGPTFIKLGQVLSTRPDLVPLDLCHELRKLQQAIPPFPFKQVKETVEEDLGQPLADVFDSFEERSIAAASIGQVHRARLKNGEDVVVKVRRPNIEDMVEIDLEVLLHLATLVERHLEEWRAQRPSRIVEEFQRVIDRELDFTAEAAHIERFAAMFHDDPTVYVPKVFRAQTTERVLTLEYLDVTPVTDVDHLVKAGFDPRVIARRGTELTLKQIFVHGFFHADPHPGNAFVLPGNVICLLDFGMVGRLDREGRERFADLIHAVAQRDSVAATAAVLQLTTYEEDTDLNVRQVEAELAEFIDIHIPTKLADLNFSKLLWGLMELVQRHRLTIPPDLVMMMKAAATAERLLTRLDPELNVITAAKPYVQRIKVNRFKPTRLAREVFHSGSELLQLAREIPGGLRDLLRLAKRGELRIGFEHRGLDETLKTHERVANRVSFAIVVAALIVGSSLLVQAGIPPTWNDIPIIGLAGYIAAGILGMLLLISIIRHGQL